MVNIDNTASSLITHVKDFETAIRILYFQSNFNVD